MKMYNYSQILFEAERIMKLHNHPIHSFENMIVYFVEIANELICICNNRYEQYYYDLLVCVKRMIKDTQKELHYRRLYHTSITPLTKETYKIALRFYKTHRITSSELIDGYINLDQIQQTDYTKFVSSLLKKALIEYFQSKKKKHFIKETKGSTDSTLIKWSKH